MEGGGGDFKKSLLLYKNNYILTGHFAERLGGMLP